MNLSSTEENYLKEIYSLSREAEKKIPNLQIGQRLGLNPPAVTEMLRKLAEKGWISYSRTEGASLTDDGEVLALQVIRKHRLWETFLVKTLGFSWDEVHEVAEQLEHIRSQKLLDELDRFLGHPEFDPHGEPIPNALGIMPLQMALSLSQCRQGEKVELLSVSSQRGDFLQSLQLAGVQLRSRFEVLISDAEEFRLRLLDSGKELSIPKPDAQGIFVGILQATR
jgi:DtxR family Mn-dependent transcriptional regulator